MCTFLLEHDAKQVTSIILGQQSSIRFVFFGKTNSYGMIHIQIVNEGQCKQR